MCALNRIRTGRAIHMRYTASYSVPARWRRGRMCNTRSPGDINHVHGRRLFCQGALTGPPTLRHIDLASKKARQGVPQDALHQRRPRGRRHRQRSSRNPTTPSGKHHHRRPHQDLPAHGRLRLQPGLPAGQPDHQHVGTRPSSASCWTCSSTGPRGPGSASCATASGRRPTATRTT